MRFAGKRLTRSDLTFFEAQFRRQNAGNQKSINLNRNVFVDLVFPGAAGRVVGPPVRFPVRLRIFGPAGNSEAHQVIRKVIAAGGSQKNWRLNGETIHSPENNRERYDNLQEGDLVVFGFGGELVPEAIDLMLLSQSAENDAGAYTTLRSILGANAMKLLSDDEIDRVRQSVQADHPLFELADPVVDDELEEAAQGSSAAVHALRRRTIRRQSAEELAAANQRATAVGRNGEVLVVAFLKKRDADGKIAGFTWESEVNAVHPWDMTVHENDGGETRVEVKTTTGPHDRGMHVSQAELEAAVEFNAPPTQIWRISALDAIGGALQCSNNFPTVAQEICDLSRSFGPGLTPDSWTISPTKFEWSDPIFLQFDDDPDE